MSKFLLIQLDVHLTAGLLNYWIARCLWGWHDYNGVQVWGRTELFRNNRAETEHSVL